MKFKKLKRSQSQKLYEELSPTARAIARKYLVKGTPPDPEPKAKQSQADMAKRVQEKIAPRLSKNTDPAMHQWRVERAKKASEASVAARQEKKAASGTNVTVWPTKRTAK